MQHFFLATYFGLCIPSVGPDTLSIFLLSSCTVPLQRMKPRSPAVWYPSICHLLVGHNATVSARDVSSIIADITSFFCFFFLVRELFTFFSTILVSVTLSPPISYCMNGILICYKLPFFWVKMVLKKCFFFIWRCYSKYFGSSQHAGSGMCFKSQKIAYANIFTTFPNWDALFFS